MGSRDKGKNKGNWLSILQQGIHTRTTKSEYGNLFSSMCQINDLGHGFFGTTKDTYSREKLLLIDKMEPKLIYSNS